MQRGTNTQRLCAVPDAARTGAAAFAPEIYVSIRFVREQRVLLTCPGCRSVVRQSPATPSSTSTCCPRLQRLTWEDGRCNDTQTLREKLGLSEKYMMTLRFEIGSLHISPAHFLCAYPWFLAFPDHIINARRLAGIGGSSSDSRVLTTSSSMYRSQAYISEYVWG
jgi:hypothetical protein